MSATLNRNQRKSMPRRMGRQALNTKGWRPDERRWLERFVEALRADYEDVVSRAVLFGSKARGDWDEESDIDVAVIVKDEKATAQRRISNMAHDGVYDWECWEAVPSLLMRTESDWARGVRWKSPFHENVEREGIQLL